MNAKEAAGQDQKQRQDKDAARGHVHLITRKTKKPRALGASAAALHIFLQFPGLVHQLTDNYFFGHKSKRAEPESSFLRITV